MLVGHLKNSHRSLRLLLCIDQSTHRFYRCFCDSNFEFSAIDKKVVIKQLLIAAAYRCSGDQIFGTPFGNSGGVATSMVSDKLDALNSPILPSFHFKSTS